MEQRGAVWGDLINGLRVLLLFHSLPNFSADQMFLNQFPIGLLSQAGYISRQNHLRNTRGAKENIIEPGKEAIQMKTLCRLDKMYMRTKLQGVYLLSLLAVGCWYWWTTLSPSTRQLCSLVQGQDQTGLCLWFSWIQLKFLHGHPRNDICTTGFSFG